MEAAIRGCPQCRDLRDGKSSKMGCPAGNPNRPPRHAGWNLKGSDGRNVRSGQGNESGCGPILCGSRLSARLHEAVSKDCGIDRVELTRELLRLPLKDSVYVVHDFRLLLVRLRNESHARAE